MTKRRVLELIAAVLLLIVIFLLLYANRMVESQNGESLSERAALLYDSDATRGGWEEADATDLDGKVEAGMMNISMNTVPVFADGTSEGNLMIVNEEVNRYPQVVEIVRNDTGETVYASGAIPVGSKIEAAKLRKELPAGKYDCTALFYNVDPDTGVKLGCAGASITITIRK